MGAVSGPTPPTTVVNPTANPANSTPASNPTAAQTSATTSPTAASPTPPAAATKAPANVGTTLCLSVLDPCNNPRNSAGVGEPGLWPSDKTLMITPESTYFPPIVPYGSNFPTFNVAGAQPVQVSKNGQPVSANTLASEFSSYFKNQLGANQAAGAQALLALIQHGDGSAFTYKINNDIFQVRANPAEGLQADPSSRECDWFANMFVWLGVASGVFKSNEAYIVEARGAAHTVAAFSLDHGKSWNIADNASPASISMVGAPSPADAVRQFFKNGDLETVKAANSNPNKNPIWLYNVKQLHLARQDGFLDLPGIDGLSGVWGTPQLLNEPGGPRLPNLSYQGATVGIDHTRVQDQGFTGEVRYDLGTGFDQPGFNVAALSQMWIKGNDLNGVKATFGRETTGGYDSDVGYDHYHINEHSFWGVTAGVEGRFGVSTQVVPDPLTEVGPIARFTAGIDGNIVGDRTTPFQLSHFHGFQFGGSFPIVLGTAADKQQLASNANGLDPNGWYDPGALGTLAFNGKSGLALRWDPNKKWTIQGATILSWEANDPSVSLVPHMALTGKVNVNYHGDKLTANFGGSVTPGGPEIVLIPNGTSNGILWHTGGSYDVDPEADLHVNGSWAFDPRISAVAQGFVSKTTGGTVEAVVAGGLRMPLPFDKKLDLSATGGIFIQDSAVRPFANLSLGTHFKGF